MHPQSGNKFLQNEAKRCESKDSKAASKRNLKTSFVFGAIAKENGINVTKEDLDAEYTKIAESYKMDVETVKKALGGRVNELANQVYQRKILTFLREVNKIA